jgi:hypothetical protein
MRPLIGVVGLLLFGTLKWAFDHFLWDWFIQFLEVKWHFREATLIASVSSYVIPLLLVVVCVLLLYWLVRHDVATKVPVVGAATRYMTAYEVLHYLADDSKWGDDTRKYVGAVRNIPMRKMPLLEALGEFKRIAEQGQIHAVGRLNGVGQHIEIPATYWMSATLSPFSTQNREISDTNPSSPNPDGIPTYRNVKIVREDVEREWQRPPPKGLKKWLRRIGG